MATLTYWICDCLDDNPAYNIRAKTKKEALQIREERGEESYDEPRKHIVNYKDAFDLMSRCLGEDRASE